MNHILKGGDSTHCGAREMEVRKPAICPSYFALGWLAAGHVRGTQSLLARLGPRASGWESWRPCPPCWTVFLLLCLSDTLENTQRLGPRYHRCVPTSCVWLACHKLGQHISVVTGSSRFSVIMPWTDVWAFPPPKFISWRPSSQGDVIRSWGLLEKVITSWV